MKLILSPDQAPVPEPELRPIDQTFILFLKQLAPLLFSTKPAVLFNSFLPFDWNSFRYLKPIADLIVPISFYHFAYQNKHSLILAYHPERLMKLTAQPENARFLYDFGYQPDFGLYAIFQHWQSRLEGEFRIGFPHETGIFLGIPLHDVRSFIRNQGKHYLFNHYWKVYHQPDQAKRIFYAYDLAKIQMSQITAKLIKKGFPEGKPFDQLI